MEKAVSYKVKDISLSDWGRKEIKLAEAEKANAQNKIDDAAPQVSVAT